MGLASFHSAVRAAAAKYAPQYGLDPSELEYALLTDAHLEGGLGETAGIGDGGASVGRFQYNTAGGHGSSVMQSTGMTKQQIADDAFQANDWAPILAQQLADVKKQGLSGGQAIARAIFQAERPAEMYPSGRVNAALNAAGGMVTLPDDPNRKFTLDQIPNADPNATPTYTPIGAGGKAVDPAWLTKYATVYSQWKPLHMKLAGYVDATGKPIGDVYPDAQGGLSVRVPRIDANGIAQPNQFDVKQIFGAAEYQSYIALDGQLSSLEGQQDPQSLDDAIKQATFSYNSDPRNIDADNAAKKYARELSATNSAITLAAKNQDAQTANQKDSMDSFNGPRGNIASFYAPQTHPQSPDSIYKDAVDTVKKNLPDVPDAPYYDPAQRGAATTPHTPFDPTDLQAQIDAEAAAKKQATIATTQSTHVPADPFAGSTPQDGGPTSFAGRIPSASMPPAGPWNPGDWAMGRIRGSIFHQSGAAPAAPTAAAPTMLAPPSVPRVAPRPFSFQAFGGAGR